MIDPPLDNDRNEKRASLSLEQKQSDGCCPAKRVSPDTQSNIMPTTP
jgi:hypothetical protein